MQARLEMKRFPLTLVAVLFALAVMLLLGGTLGYALKPATTVSGPTHVIVVPASQLGGANISDNACQFIDHIKSC
jgi:hypothetical protein